MKKNESSNIYLYLTILALGLVWLKSIVGKLAGGEFVMNLPATLAKFASKNPYPFFEDFLRSVAIPNAYLFAILTLFGELFAAVSLVGVAGFLIFGGKKKEILMMVLSMGLLTGAFLNLIFFLGSGWMSPSTESLNLLMMGLELAALVWVIKANK